jgi:excisionase family DNA binding protein
MRDAALWKTPQERKIDTVTEAAEFLHVSRATSYRMIKGCELLGAFRIGAIWRFDLDELERFTKTNAKGAK